MQSAFARAGVAIAPQPPVKAEPESLTQRIADLRASHQSAVTGLRERLRALEVDHDRAAREVEIARQREGRLASDIDATHVELARVGAAAAERDSTVVADHLGALVRKLDTGLAVVTQLRDAVAAAEGRAQHQSPEAAKKYADLRRRIGGPPAMDDELVTEGLKALEATYRSKFHELAEAMDRAEKTPAVTARFTAFLPTPGEPQHIVIVAPTNADGRPSADLRLRLRYVLWHLAERCAREIATEGGVDHGTVEGLVAVKIGNVDMPDLLHLALDEAWGHRPTLEESGIAPVLEIIAGVTPRWSPDETTVSAGGLAATDTTERSIATVASRLDVDVRDLIAILCDRGLPFPDDEIEEGSELTLGELLGKVGRSANGDDSNVKPAMQDVGLVMVEAAVVTAGGARIAARMLTKLMRDGRIGGRHTRFEDAHAHHFADGEKERAKRVADFLERDGIFMPKINEGARQVSINPRRLTDVGRIIDGTWDRAEVLNDL